MLVHPSEPTTTTMVEDDSNHTTRTATTTPTRRHTTTTTTTRLPLIVKWKSRRRDVFMDKSRSRPRMTRLVELLNDRDWKGVMWRLQKSPKETMVWTMASKIVMLPLHWALLSKAPYAVVARLVRKNPNARRRKDSLGMTPLHVACHAGVSLPIVQLLANDAHNDSESGCLCEERDVNGRTALHVACASHALRLDVISYLLTLHPSAATEVDQKGLLPADYIGPHPHEALVRTELERGKDYWLAGEDHTELVQCILERDWDSVMDVLSDEAAAEWVFVEGHRFLPLHLACREQPPLEVTEALVSANPNALSRPCQEHGMLPLHLACQYGATTRSVMALLESCPEAASVRDTHGLVPLHLACTEGASWETVHELFSCVAEFSQCRDRRGWTPLDYARASRHPHAHRIVELFQQHAAKNNNKDEEEEEDTKTLDTALDAPTTTTTTTRDKKDKNRKKKKKKNKGVDEAPVTPTRRLSVTRQLSESPPTTPDALEASSTGSEELSVSPTRRASFGLESRKSICD